MKMCFNKVAFACKNVLVYLFVFTCFSGLTALKSDQVHELMARDYPDKFKVGESVDLGVFVCVCVGVSECWCVRACVCLRACVMDHCKRQLWQQTRAGSNCDCMMVVLPGVCCGVASARTAEDYWPPQRLWVGKSSMCLNNNYCSFISIRGSGPFHYISWPVIPSSHVSFAHI